MPLYHATTLQHASEIEHHGFTNGPPTALTGRRLIGVHVMESPSWESHDKPLCVEVAVEPRRVRVYEFTQPGKPGRQWIVPATVLNAFLRRTIARPTGWARRHDGTQRHPLSRMI